MLTIGGLVFLLVCVFGSYVLSGGSLEPLMEAMPFELLTIGGAAIGTFVMSNSLHDVKHTLAGFKKILKGAAFKKSHYVDLLSLMFFFTRLATSKGTMALEPHIEAPANSTAFQKFPQILANHHATDMICDYLRMLGMNADDPHQIEDLMGRELKKTLHEELHGAHALQSMADGLPALGIVAAVAAETGQDVETLIGTMIEIPRAALTAGQIAGAADFFSFGTNDLTQMGWGFSRDDVEASFFSRYLDLGIFGVSPFESLDREGVGRLVRIAVEEGH